MRSLTETARLQASWRDYLELTKPKVVALMIITSAIGMLLATEGAVPWSILVAGNLGIALCARSAAAINHVVDRRIDLHMARTQRRPLAQGRVNPVNAVLFATLLGVAGMAILLHWVNALTAWLTLGSLLGYAVIYTSFLKRATPQNIVIGGLAGAAPPLLGWTAVTGQMDAEGLLLVHLRSREIRSGREIKRGRDIRSAERLRGAGRLGVGERVAGSGPQRD